MMLFDIVVGLALRRETMNLINTKPLYFPRTKVSLLSQALGF
jgi:hypothetical protein